MANQVDLRPNLPNPFKNNLPPSLDVVDNPPGNTASVPSTNYLTTAMTTTDPMKSEKNRLETFKNPNWKCSFMDPKKLARSGFYYFGKEDHVRCAFCKVEIGKWEPGDDCDSDHQRWGSNCPFLRGFEVGNIPLDPTQQRPTRPRSQDICGRFGIEIRPNSVPEDYSSQRDVDVTPLDTRENVNLKDIGINPHQGPIHRRYCTEESRIATFREWPRIMKQKPHELAEAGFFYTGRGDQTTCFHCGLGLKDWEENDDPWEQHARWYSKCTHVLLNKGRDFVQQVLSKQPPVLSREDALQLIHNSTNSTSFSDNNVASSSTLSNSSSEINISSVESRTSDEHNKKPTLASIERKSTLEDNASSVKSNSPSGDEGCLCQICYLERWNVLFLPCKHALACKKCAPLLSTCPLCREQITATLRIYPSCSHDHRDS